MNKRIPEISDELIEKAKEFIGEEGIDHFKKLIEKFGDKWSYSVSSVKYGIPHAVHFQEGMQVRNFMRGTGLCEDWTDHELDDNWDRVIEGAIK